MPQEPRGGGMNYKGPHGQLGCPRMPRCNAGRMPSIQRSNYRCRIVCPCGSAGPWGTKVSEAVEGWNALPRLPAYSSSRPTSPGPHWCRTPGGHSAIVDLTDEDVAGLTMTLGCYSNYCRIEEPEAHGT